MGKISGYPQVNSMGSGDYFLIDTTPITSNSTSIITKANALSSILANPMTTLGDTMYGGASGTVTRLAGSTNASKRYLSQTGTGSASAVPVWGAIAAGDVPTLNQSTTGNAATATAALGLKSATSTVAISSATAPSNGQVLTASSSTAASWVNATSGFANPMTNNGDIIYGASAGVATRLAAGSNNQVLTLNSGIPSWQTPSAATATFFNVKTYGAIGNGSNDDTIAIQSAINAALATVNGTATVYFPAGQYKVSAALNCTGATVSAGGNGVILRGDGHSASTIVKASSFGFACTWNGNGGPDGNPTSYGGMIDITIEGNATTGGLVQTNSANQMFFRGCSFNGSNDVVFDFNTMQDSYFSQITMNTNHPASAPIIHIYGSGDGNTNQLFFSQMRIEDFYGTAIKIEAGSGNSSTNNGFYFSDVKLETGNVSADFFVADDSTLDLHIERMFGSANSYKSGSSTPVSLIKTAAYQSVSYRDIYFNDGIGGQVAAINAQPTGGDFGIAMAENVFYNGDGNTGTINFGSTISNMVWTILGCGTDGAAPVLAGTLPYQLVTLNNNAIGGGTMTGNLNYQNNAVTVTSNAGTCLPAFRLNTFTNSSAVNMTITMSTTGAIDGELMTVRVYDFSAVAKTITWVNTENSTVTAPTTSNGSTTLPLTVGFMYNSATSKWRCIWKA